MKSEFQHGRVPRPTLVMGRVVVQPKQTTLTSLTPHPEQMLAYQQRIAALIECAREYAHNPSDAHAIKELLRVAAAFTENG
jgi:hypothetical protein